jgi:hypothetical protein
MFFWSEIPCFYTTITPFTVMSFLLYLLFFFFSFVFSGGFYVCF